VTAPPKLKYVPARYLLLLLALGALLAGCRTTTSTQAATIGLVAPFEGAQRELGYEVLVAVKIAVAEQNAAGGWFGRPIALVALNDEGEPAQAALAARELALDPSIVGVVGHWSPQTTAAALPVYLEAGLRLVIPSAGDYAIPIPSHVRQFGPSNDDIARALVSFLRQRAAIQKVQTVALEIEPAGLAQKVAAALQAAGFTMAASDEPVDVVALWLPDEETARFLAAAPPMLVVLLDGPYIPLLGKLGPVDAGVMTWMPSEVGWAAPFEASFRRATGHGPSPQAWLAYEATAALMPADSGPMASPAVSFAPAAFLVNR